MMTGIKPHSHSETLAKAYRSATHRLVSPEDTWHRVRPHMAAIEVTRLADVTGLDRIGIPVCCAIRPRGLILQSTNGKGTRPIEAKVSALMEALEHHHAERPLQHVRRASTNELRAEGLRVAPPDAFAQYRAGTFWSDDFVIPWVPAEDLLSGAQTWIPATTVYSGVTPCVHDFTANGLASGNHLVEATLHALYEIIERDAISRLSVDGRIRLGPPACRVVDTRTVDGLVRDLRERLDAADITLVLLAAHSVTSVHTFWAVLVDRSPFSPSSMVNVGYGAHLSPEVAAVRAITEAAQSRVCYIHGAREDLAAKMRTHAQDRVRSLATQFTGLVADADFRDLEDGSSGSLQDDLRRVLSALAATPGRAVYRVNLTRAPFDLPVVKLLVPGLRLNRRFF
jgi:ribosomal protein S12 methylthiotransferase accessory factor